MCQESWPESWGAALWLTSAYVPSAYRKPDQGLRSSGRRFTWQSERDGWRRLYLVSREGELQPAVLLLHQDAAAGIATCVAQDRLKLAIALEWTASEMATARGVPPDHVFWRTDLPLHRSGEHPRWLEERLPEFRADDQARRWWFANLNTPEELSEAQEYIESLKR